MLDSEAIAKELIRSFFSALKNKDVASIRSFCDEDVILNWGPYVFKGREQIIRWVKEFLIQFPYMKCKETEFKLEGNNASEKIILEITTQKGHKGVIRCEGLFKYKNRKLKMIKIVLFSGVILIEKEESVGLNLHKIKV